jgi:hypothetical protein
MDANAYDHVYRHAHGNKNACARSDTNADANNYTYVFANAHSCRIV